MTFVDERPAPALSPQVNQCSGSGTACSTAPQRIGEDPDRAADRADVLDLAGFDPVVDRAEGLKAIKERDGVLESEQIRRAINDWLEKKGAGRSDRKRVTSRKRS